MSSLRILITGASSGIGQATAVHLVQKGHQVLMTGRRAEKLKETAGAAPAVVGEFLVDTLDVSSQESVKAFVDKHASWLKKVDVLINNAGLALGRDSLDKVSATDLKQMIDTNVTGLLDMTRLVLPFMKARGTGHIVNMGSVAGPRPYAGGTVYCATKAAVHAATEALRMDLGGSGIRVTTIAPGRVSETEFSEVRFRGDKAAAAKVYEGFESLTAHDVAETIAWVLERPAHVNIQEITLMSTDQVNSTTVVPRARK